MEAWERDSSGFPRNGNGRRKAIDTRTRKGIPVTSPIQTLIDIAPLLDEPHLERAVNEAINKDLTDPDELRKAVTSGKLCLLLDRDTFTVTDTELEQRFLPIARAAGFPKPLTQVRYASHLNQCRCAGNCGGATVNFST